MHDWAPEQGRRSQVGRRRCWSLIVGGCAAAALSLVACSADPLQLPRDAPPEIAPFVTAEAAANLGADGLFTDINANAGSSGRVEITSARAAELAAAWIRDYAGWLRPSLSAEHGDDVEVAALGVCGRPLYAESPFEPLPEELPAPNHKGYGPYWILTLCGREGVAQVLLAVSAYNADLLDEAGRHRPVVHGGNEYASIGIPGGRLDELLPSPEQATFMIGSGTRRRVREAPQLVLGAGGPWSSVWRVLLDQPASVLASESGRTVLTDELYVARLLAGPTRRVVAVAVPKREQPEGVTFRYVMPFLPGQEAPITYGTATARRRPTIPVRFEPIIAEPREEP